MRTYKQLTYKQRCQIAALNGTDMAQQEMADAVGTSQGTATQPKPAWLSPQRAQKLADERRHSAAKAVKITESMIVIIEEKLCEKWSLEQVSGWLPDERGEHLSHERIYQYIWDDKAAGGEHCIT